MQNSFRTYLRSIFDLRDGTDVKGTIDSIRNAVTIRGYNVWILACGALIASIGLNTNSPAVIIGAMLISPLMSPILGIGLSVGINDRDSLVHSLENFGIAVTASLVMSTIYFALTPLREVTPELMLRTHPTLLDAGVAFFGGIAGIVAGSRVEKTNAIPGVAIATALMPPLCTAGFGIAHANWEIFWGAFYLFFLNSALIALSTYLIVRFLNFPYVDYVDGKARRKVSRAITAFAILIIIPSLYFFSGILRDLRQRRNIKTFIEQAINNDQREVLNYTFIKSDSLNTIKLYMTGTYIEEKEKDSLNQLLPSFKLDDCQIKLTQNIPPLREDQMVNQVRVEVLQALEYQEKQIDAKQTQIDSLSNAITAFRSDTLPFLSIKKELKILYPNLEKISLSKAIETDFEAYQDTIPTLILDWDKNIGWKSKRANEKKMKAFVSQRIGIDTLRIVSN